MTAKNTLIIGVFGEVPYAESVGDVNIPYCRSSDIGQYCNYDPVLNPYVSLSQSQDLTIDFNQFETDVITTTRKTDKTIPLVSVLFTGRPVPIGNIYNQSNAVISAWLPGTSGGQGVVDLISGAYVARAGGDSNRKNSLSVDWPRSMVIMGLLRIRLMMSFRFMGLMGRYQRWI
jgi:beta-glucosidase